MLKKLFFHLLFLVFVFSQDYSLSFDGINDYVDLGTGGLSSNDNTYTQEIIFNNCVIIFNYNFNN